MGFRPLGFGVWGLGLWEFRVLGVESSGFSVEGLGYRDLSDLIGVEGLRVYGLGLVWANVGFGKTECWN